VPTGIAPHLGIPESVSAVFQFIPPEWAEGTRPLPRAARESIIICQYSSYLLPAVVMIGYPTTHKQLQQLQFFHDSGLRHTPEIGQPRL
jgi:hypothetical protein